MALTKHSFAAASAGTAGRGTSGITRVAHGATGSKMEVPRLLLWPPPALATLVSLTQRQLTGEWARPAAPNCAGSSSRARAGWRPDTAGTTGDSQGGQGVAWGLGCRQEQAALSQERVQAGEPPELLQHQHRDKHNPRGHQEPLRLPLGLIVTDWGQQTSSDSPGGTTAYLVGFGQLPEASLQVVEVLVPVQDEPGRTGRTGLAGKVPQGTPADVTALRGGGREKGSVPRSGSQQPPQPPV